MKKIVIIDLVNGCESWCRDNIRGDVHLYDVLSIDTLTNIVNYPDADYILVFESDVRDYLTNIFNMLNIPESKILYALDYLYLYNHHSAISEIALPNLMSHIEWCMQNVNKKYALCQVSNLVYIGTTSDECILPSMQLTHKNWAQDDMLTFKSLAYEYYPEKVALEDGYFFDIGANIGTTCIYFKKHIDPSLKIVAFEPSDENFKLLKTNVFLNDISDDEAILNKIALSDVESEYSLKYNPSNPGMSHISSNTNETNVSKTFSTTFDKFIENNQIDPQKIKYIWIDIEGFEGALFDGAIDTLSKINVPIVTEFTPVFLKRYNSYDRLINILSKLYKSFIVISDANHNIHPIEDLYKTGEYEQLDIFLLK